MTEYHYKITQMHASSDRYGPCEVCREFVSDVYYLSESCKRSNNHFTQLNCKSLFGHKECLDGAMR
jgi:hypothetical protein